MINMLFFNKRKQLEELYQKFLKENPEVKDCSFSVITFLVGEGLINEEKALERIDKERD